jgi:hypothetical protein
MNFNVYVFYSQVSHKHVLAVIAAIFRVMYYNGTNVVSHVAVTP